MNTFCHAVYYICVKFNRQCCVNHDAREYGASWLLTMSLHSLADSVLFQSGY